MSNKYTREIMSEYEKLQNEDVLRQQERQKEIYHKLPRVKEIDDEIYHVGIEIASSVFKGVDMGKLISEKKKQILDLKIEKSEILSQNRYSVDYLEIHYKCQKCKDTGYIGSNRCTCFKQKLIEKYYQQSNIKDILRRENFDTFNFNLYSNQPYPPSGLSPRQNMENIYGFAVNYVQHFGSGSKNILFYGNSGLGKTFLANCISKSLLDMQKTVLYNTSAGLIDMLRAIRFDDSKDEHDEALSEIMNCDMLVIDDLGTETMNSFSYSELFNIINTRLLKNKKMIISTNYTLDDLLKNYPERITSRILGNFEIKKFFGDDIRLKVILKK